MSLFGRKPRTLGEVIRRVKTREQKFDPSLREFLDSFYVNPDSRQQAIDERPAPVDAVHDAYVAAVAEHFARVTVCGYQSGARPMATGFANRSSPAVCNLSKVCWSPRARRPFVGVSCS